MVTLACLSSCATGEQPQEPPVPALSKAEVREAQECRDERVIRAACTRMLTTYENQDGESLAGYLAPLEEERKVLAGYDVDVYELAAHCFEHFSWHIDGIEVQGDTATVAVTVSNVDVAKAMDQVTREVDEDPSELHELYEQEGFEALMHELFEKAYDQLAEKGELVSTQVSLAYAKDDAGVWELGNDSLVAFAHAAMGASDEGDAS